ncbi:MAG: glycosyltransferase, partial [Deltaproteobacteria bacterium]|nr:glycosyltransferase [Deltaproteobacteria bacterium]
MKVIVMSHMFPNKVLPNSGIFVKERIKHIASKVNIVMVAPVPIFPMLSIAGKYKGINEIEKVENFEGLYVLHPRYFLIPRYCKYFDGYLYYCSLNSFIKKQFLQNDFDLFDFHWVYPDAFAGLRWARKFNKKIVVTIRGNESICYFENSLRKKMVINTLKSVDHIIAVSNDMKQKVAGEYGVEHSKITVIPNGIEPQDFYM